MPYYFPQRPTIYNNYQYNNYYNYYNYYGNKIENKNLDIGTNNIKYNSFEYLLSTPEIINDVNKESIEYKKKLTIFDFQKRNINNLKEDLIYYYSAPESLMNFKSSLDEEIQFDFYNDLDSENFLDIQKRKI